MTTDDDGGRMSKDGDCKMEYIANNIEEAQTRADDRVRGDSTSADE